MKSIRAWLQLLVAILVMFGCARYDQGRVQQSQVKPPVRVSGFHVKSTGCVALKQTSVGSSLGTLMLSNDAPEINNRHGSVEFIADIPTTYEKHRTFGEHWQDDAMDEAMDVPITATLKLQDYPAEPLDLSWTSERARIAFGFRVDYPPDVKTAEILFADPKTKELVSKWTVTDLQPTRDSLDKEAKSEFVRVSKTAELKLYARRLARTADSPAAIAMGGMLTDNNWLIKNAYFVLPFESDLAPRTEAFAFASARRFLVAFSTQYSKQIHAIEIRGELEGFDSTTKALRCPPFLIQKVGNGFSVAGRRWSCNVDDFRVTVTAPTSPDREFKPGVLSIQFEVTTATKNKIWFEPKGPNGSFYGQGTRLRMDIPFNGTGRKMELEIQGRVCEPRQSQAFRVIVPVKEGPVSKGLPLPTHDALWNPLLEGGSSGFSEGD